MGEGFRALFVEFVFNGPMMKITISSTNSFPVGQAFSVWKVNLLSSELRLHLEGLRTTMTCKAKHPSLAQFWSSHHQMGFGGLGGERGL